MTLSPESLTIEQIVAFFEDFSKLHVAYGDASPNTIRSYLIHIRQFVQWCVDRQIDPAWATEQDVSRYRRFLVEPYAGGTVATKLAALRRPFEALLWRGLRADNPAAGVRASKQRTHCADTVKYLPLNALRELLNALLGDTPQSLRDHTLLALQGKLGLCVSEVARPQLDAQGKRWLGMVTGDVDIEGGLLHVYGKGCKQRTVHLTLATQDVLTQWLAVRDGVARSDERALFVTFDRHAPGREMSIRAIRWTVDKYLSQLGLKAKGFSCHSLRHSTVPPGGATPIPRSFMPKSWTIIDPKNWTTCDMKNRV